MQGEGGNLFEPQLKLTLNEHDGRVSIIESRYLMPQHQRLLLLLKNDRDMLARRVGAESVDAVIKCIEDNVKAVGVIDNSQGFSLEIALKKEDGGLRSELDRIFKIDYVIKYLRALYRDERRYCMSRRAALMAAKTKTYDKTDKAPVRKGIKLMQRYVKEYQRELRNYPGLPLFPKTPAMTFDTWVVYNELCRIWHDLDRERRLLEDEWMRLRSADLTRIASSLKMRRDRLEFHLYKLSRFTYDMPFKHPGGKNIISTKPTLFFEMGAFFEDDRFSTEITRRVKESGTDFIGEQDERPIELFLRPSEDLRKDMRSKGFGYYSESESTRLLDIAATYCGGKWFTYSKAQKSKFGPIDERVLFSDLGLTDMANKKGAGFVRKQLIEAMQFFKDAAHLDSFEVKIGDVVTYEWKCLNFYILYQDSTQNWSPGKAVEVAKVKKNTRAKKR